MADRVTIALVTKARRAHLKADEAAQRGASPQVIALGLLEGIYLTNLAILGRLATEVEAAEVIAGAAEAASR